MAPLCERVLLVQTQAENAGAQEITRLLGEGLAARGYDVHHLFFYRKSATFQEPPNTHFIYHERPGNPIALIRFYSALLKKMRALSPAAIFTFQHYGNVLGAPAARLARLSPIVANQVSAREVVNPVLRIADYLLCIAGVYDNVTANSKMLFQQYEALGSAYAKDLCYVPHGVSRKTSTLDKKSARQHFGLPVNGPLIGLTARLNATKQIDRAIALLAQNCDWHLAVAGDGALRDNLHKLAANLGVSERCHLLGEIQPSAIGDFLKALDVFVFPSNAETFGLAPVEAALTGLPVVCNDLPVLREVLSVDGKPIASFVDVQDINAFSSATATALGEHSTDEPKAQHRLADFSRLYAIDEMVDAYETLLTKRKVKQLRLRKHPVL